MNPCRRVLALLSASILLSGIALAQAPALGDVARDNEQRKNSEPGRKARRVITDDDLPSKPASPPEESAPVPKATPTRDRLTEGASESAHRPTPEELNQTKAQFLKLKGVIADMERKAREYSQDADQKAEILKNARASGLCNAQKLTGGTTTCEVIESEQRALQQINRELPNAKARLQSIQQRLRSLGYGSSVYDP